MPPLDPNSVKQLHKIAQEATTNAIKHGQARRVSLHVVPAGDRLVLTTTVANLVRLKPHVDKW